VCCGASYLNAPMLLQTTSCMEYKWNNVQPVLQVRAIGRKP